MPGLRMGEGIGASTLVFNSEKAESRERYMHNVKGSAKWDSIPQILFEGEDSDSDT